MGLFGSDDIEPERDDLDLPEFEEPLSEYAFCPPRMMTQCMGHESVEHRLLEMAQSGRLAHGLIFSGSKGIGKATMAYRFARYLLKEGKEDPNQDALFADEMPAPQDLFIPQNDPVFRRVASGGHPDFMSVERAFDTAKNRYKESVAVDEIRKVPGFLRMTASEGGRRVVIIDDADTMNRNAQNALLKVLEEPPNKAVLILVTHRLGALIPTIRSRAQVVNFQPLPKETLKELLAHQSYGLSPTQIENLSEFAEGSIGKAVRYIEEGGLDAFSQILELLENYPKLSWPKIHQVAENLGRSGEEERYHMFTQLLLWCFDKLAVMKARALTPESLSTLDQNVFKTMLNNSSLEQRLKICENLHAHFAKVRAANLDKKQGIIIAFSILNEAA